MGCGFRGEVELVPLRTTLPFTRVDEFMNAASALLYSEFVDDAMSEDELREAAGRNTVYIGRQKPVMNYVLAALTCLSNSHDVTLKARGAAISLAVDVSQITMNRFDPTCRVVDIKLGTEQLQSEEGGTRNVSSIEIRLADSSAERGEAAKPA